MIAYVDMLAMHIATGSIVLKFSLPAHNVVLAYVVVVVVVVTPCTHATIA